MKKMDRTGEENYNKFGTLMKIVEYKDTNNIIVEFQDEYKFRKECGYSKFKKGNVKNPYDKSVYGVGYLGQGKYEASKNRKPTNMYKVWFGMLERCYDPYYLNKYPTYIDCHVCEDWLNFQNFAEWYEDNYYEIEDERMELDKDILIKGNKIYSPETCVFVPQRINYLFTKRDNKRGKYPIGVSYHKVSNKFQANCRIIAGCNKKKMYLGTYDTIEEAFMTYKTFKENYIKQVADEYKDLIPERLYEAMNSREVEIND